MAIRLSPKIENVKASMKDVSTLFAGVYAAGDITPNFPHRKE